jgi:hypothetical protein
MGRTVTGSQLVLKFLISAQKGSFAKTARMAGILPLLEVSNRCMKGFNLLEDCMASRESVFIERSNEYLPHLIVNQQCEPMAISID